MNQKLRSFTCQSLFLILFLSFFMSIIVFGTMVVHAQTLSPDITAPTIDLSTLTINQSTAKPGDTIILRVKASDDLSGIKHLYFFLENTNGGSTGKYATVPDAEGYYTASFPITEDTHSGEWSLSSLQATDNNSNYKRYYNSSSDFSAVKFVVESPADITAPTIDLSTLTINQSTAKPGDTIILRVKASDDLSGIKHLYFFLENTNGGSTGKYATVPDAEGYYTASFPITEDTHSGEWSLSSLQATDNNSNYKRYYNSSSDLSKAVFTVFDITLPANKINAQYVANNTTWTYKTIDSDVYIGPNAILTINGDVKINGNLYILGAVVSYGKLTVNNVYANSVYSGYSSTLSQGSFHIRGGSHIINDLTATTQPIPSLPIEIYSSNTADKDGYLPLIEGAVLPVADLYLEGEKVQYAYNGTFSLEHFYVGSKQSLEFKMVDVFGKSHIFKYVLDQGIPSPVTLESIKIETLPNDLEYKVGEKLNLTGLKVMGYYSNGTNVPVNITDSNISGFNSQTPVQGQTVTITADGKTAFFNVDIIADPVLYTVTFNSQSGSSVASKTVTANSLLAAPAAPTRTGYTFAGWFKETEGVSSWNFTTDRLTANTTLYAKWIANKYTVTFNSQGGSSVAAKTAIHNTLIIAPTAPTRTGYTFAGWYKDAGYVAVWDFAADRVTANTTLYAKWIANKYTVTFNSQGGSAVSARSADHNALITAPTAPTRTGYTFAGWYKDAGYGTAWDFVADRVTANTILYAKWIVSKYTITFNSQGGTAVSAKSAGYNALIAAPVAPTRTGFAFGGWFKEAEGITLWDFAADRVNADMTLFAKWIGIPYNLKVDSTDYNSINLTWWEPAGASGYNIYRATSSTGTYSHIGTTTATFYLDKDLITGTTYYYKISAYHSSTNNSGPYSTIISAKPTLPMPASLKAASSSYSGATLTWEAANGAIGYNIYRATSSTGTYSYIGTTTTTTYNNTGLSTGKTYYYKIRAYRTVSTIKIYSSYTGIVSVKPILTVPTNFTALRSTSTSIKTAWSSVSGASGYEVWRATSSTGTYYLRTTRTTLTYTNTGLTTGKTYYYKVRAYRMVGTSKVYSTWSPIKSARP